MKEAKSKTEKYYDIHNLVAQDENKNRERLLSLFKESPLPDDELLENLALYIKRQDMSRILFMHELYKKIINVHGVIIEFGVRWGRNLSLFESFRGMYEPFNHNRKIVGFDTFEGLYSINQKDGKFAHTKQGNFNVSKKYELYLEKVLDCHEQESPLSHIKKYEIVKGDAVEKIEKYFEKNPETIIALAYFDFDIYEPTKKCLEAIKSHVTKGTIIGFDELNAHAWPGETLALKEVFGLDRFEIKRLPFNPCSSYIIIE